MYILSYNKSQYIYIYTVYKIYTESESFKEYQVDCKSYLPKVIPGPQHIQKTSLGGPIHQQQPTAIRALDHPMSINTVEKGTWRRVRSHGRKMIDSVCWKSLTKPIWGVSVRWSVRWCFTQTNSLPQLWVVALCVSQTMEYQRRMWRNSNWSPTLSWLG